MKPKMATRLSVSPFDKIVLIFMEPDVDRAKMSVGLFFFFFVCLF